MRNLQSIIHQNTERQASYLLARFKEEAQTRSGFTMNHAGQLINPTSGFAVAYKEAPLTLRGLQQELQANPELNLGYWLEEGIGYTDLVNIIQDRETAIKQGLMYNQRAIYDFNTNEVVWL